MAKEEIFAHNEKNDDCQFSLQEIFNYNICKKPEKEIITNTRLKLTDGNKIIRPKEQGNLKFTSLINNQHNIISKAWYNQIIMSQMPIYTELGTYDINESKTDAHLSA